MTDHLANAQASLEHARKVHSQDIADAAVKMAQTETLLAIGQAVRDIEFGLTQLRASFDGMAAELRTSNLIAYSTAAPAAHYMPTLDAAGEALGVEAIDREAGAI